MKANKKRRKEEEEEGEAKKRYGNLKFSMDTCFGVMWNNL